MNSWQPAVWFAFASACLLPAVFAQIGDRQDALFSGIGGREFTLLQRLLADPAWRADDADANKILSGLARGVFASRNTAHIGQVIDAIAAQTPAESKRALALMDGMYLAAGDTRRPLQFPREPAGWSTVAKQPAFKSRVARIDALLRWPGKTGAVAAAVTPLTTEEQARFDTGKTLFGAICAACHQGTGRGAEGLAPPLVDSEWVLGPAERLTRIVLHGVRGPIRVAGRTHTGDMPAFGGLDDNQLASILTYVRREWGHGAAPIAPAQVKATRAATAGHRDAWSPEELMQVK
ncbi:MAG: c-type cytochrome [Opitutaceae bacterium]|nr:c-type cytochrome [Opitutaceae bacterium]